MTSMNGLAKFPNLEWKKGDKRYRFSLRKESRSPPTTTNQMISAETLQHNAVATL